HRTSTLSLHDALPIYHSPRFKINLRVVTGDGEIVHGQIIVRGAPDGHRAASHRHLSYKFVIEHEAEFRHFHFPPALPLLPKLLLRFFHAPRRHNHENHHPFDSLSIRAITTVMLSGPPRSFAMDTSSSAPRIASVSACSTPAISGSVTTRVNPSEHNSKTSRGNRTCSSASTSISGCAPSARNNTLCISLCSASATVIIPWRTCSATSEWSRVSCSSVPPRSRYARLSPTCAMLSRERSIHAAVSVAPMPRCSGCSFADLQMLLFARCSAVASRFVFALQPGSTFAKTFAAGLASASRLCFTTVSTASALAISPCASPPIPSAST